MYQPSYKASRKQAHCMSKMDKKDQTHVLEQALWPWRLVSREPKPKNDTVLYTSLHQNGKRYHEMPHAACTWSTNCERLKHRSSQNLPTLQIREHDYEQGDAPENNAGRCDVECQLQVQRCSVRDNVDGARPTGKHTAFWSQGGSWPYHMLFQIRLEIHAKDSCIHTKGYLSKSIPEIGSWKLTGQFWRVLKIEKGRGREGKSIVACNKCPKGRAEGADLKQQLQSAHLKTPWAAVIMKMSHLHFQVASKKCSQVCE